MEMMGFTTTWIPCDELRDGMEFSHHDFTSNDDSGPWRGPLAQWRLDITTHVTIIVLFS
jgi:hypothetical protein